MSGYGNSSTSTLKSQIDAPSSAYTLKEKFSFIYNNERFSDVCFVVGQMPYFQKIPAHKLVLSIGSEVFETMFSSNWISNDASEIKGEIEAPHVEPRKMEIEVPDIEPEIFLKMLRFLYLEEYSQHITAGTAEGLLYAANKYAISPLEKECISFLEKQASSSNVFSTLRLAEIYCAKSLKDRCHQIIRVSTRDVLMSKEFPDIDNKTLRYILNQEYLNIREVELFVAMKRWSKAECAREGLEDKSENHQVILKTLLPLVRFPVMTAAEIASEVAKSGLLSQEVVINLFQYLLVTPQPPVPNKFNGCPRKSDNNRW